MTFRFVPIFTFYSSMKVLFKEKQTHLYYCFCMVFTQKVRMEKVRTKMEFPTFFLIFF